MCVRTIELQQVGGARCRRIVKINFYLKMLKMLKMLKVFVGRDVLGVVQEERDMASVVVKYCGCAGVARAWFVRKLGGPGGQGCPRFSLAQRALLQVAEVGEVHSEL